MKLLLEKRLQEFQETVLNSKVTDGRNVELLLEDGISNVFFNLMNVRKKNTNLYIIGNGGSAAIASHAVVDFFNVGKVRSYTLHDSAMLTCMGNDYGYGNTFSKLASRLIDSDDLLIAISSSGSSKNIIGAAEVAKKNGVKVITFSGFEEDNNLRKVGDINFWCNSNDYGMVEIAHQFLLHNLADRLA